jgi:hypothetical protein
MRRDDLERTPPPSTNFRARASLAAENGFCNCSLVGMKSDAPDASA